MEDDNSATTGDILSSNNVIHCKLTIEHEGSNIRYTIHSPIIDHFKEDVTDTFPNGTLDSRIEKIIKTRILDYIDNENIKNDISIGQSVYSICQEARESEWYLPNHQANGKWAGFQVPVGYDIGEGCIRLERTRGDDTQYIPFCRVPCMTTATGRNIDNDEYWVKLQFMNIYNTPHEEWVSQQDALSRRGVMKLADRGINLIEKNASAMNEYLSACLKTNSMELPRKFVTEKNGWKCDNTIFACGKRGFLNGKAIEIIPLRKEAYNGLKVHGTIEAWVEAVKPVIHLPLIRLKMYAVFTAPLLRILNVQSFILDHNGESSIGKTFSNDLAMSMLGDSDVLRFNGDTTKTAAEILAEMYTDLPLYLDETGTQQTEDVLKAIVYMLSNEQGRMRGHKDGGLRETGKWKTVALTTGEKPLTSHKSFSGQQVRVIEVNGGLTQDVIEDVKVAADARKENYGHFVEPFFAKLDQYQNQLENMYRMSRERYITTDNVKTNRMAGSFAAMLVAGMFVEDIFSDIGIETVDPREIIDHFFEKCVLEKPIVNYSVRALQTVMDWVQSKNVCFWNDDEPSEYRTNEFYGWIDNEYIDVIPSELRKLMERSGFDTVRTREDWSNLGIVRTNSGRNDYNARHNGKTTKVIRFVKEVVDNVLFS